MNVDISYTAPGILNGRERRFTDPTTVEILFLSEVVDNPSNTITKYITSSLLAENANQSPDEYLMSQFPVGIETLISSSLDDVIDFLLFEQDDIFNSYTSRLLRSIYWPNIISGYTESFHLRDRKRSFREGSTVTTLTDCTTRLTQLLDLLSRSVDLSDPDMKLPLPVACKLFSRLSVLLSIPISRESALGALLMNHPLIPHLEAWAEKVNAGCRLWSPGIISWRRKHRGVGADSPKSTEKSTYAWWEWIGWSGEPLKVQRDESFPGFVPDKSHNVLFAMVAVGTIFVYLGVLSSRDRE